MDARRSTIESSLEQELSSSLPRQTCYPVSEAQYKVVQFKWASNGGAPSMYLSISTPLTQYKQKLNKIKSLELTILIGVKK